MSQDAAKRAAALAALELIRPTLTRETIIGVGTGSTANHFIDALASAKHLFDAAVASSNATEARLRGHGIAVLALTAAPRVAVYVDGADEIDGQRCMIKGAGGALTREKIVAAASDQFVCIVDESKCVARLGGFPVPIEVIPMGRSVVGRAIVLMGGQPLLRENVVTDNGNLILDVTGLDLGDPAAMESRLNDIPGVVCNGLFAQRKADRVVVGSAQGARVLG